MVRIGVDTGGTFTDLVWVRDGRRESHKVPSTPEDPSRAILQGLRDLLGTPPDAAAGPVVLPAGTTLVHGSTVATNALLEGEGARVALVTNAGFEDLLDIGRQARPDLYDASVLPPPPLVDAGHRIGVRGRLGPDGAEIRSLDTEALRRAIQAALAAGVERFAVCFLHAYANPAHEEQAAEVIEAAGGEASLSSQILPEYREFERASTTVVNAALSPIMTAYLERLAQNLGKTRLAVFRSNGGILSAGAAGREAVNTLLSGPAAGVVGAVSWGRRAGLERLITFDMGGTSTDVSLCNGEPSVTTEAVVAGYPVSVPLIDIHTIGAGGGSIARVDSGGALVVGPRSAGADPGPACYGRGGEPTVTDAQVVLGRIPPEAFLGGRMRLDAGRAAAVVERLAGACGLGLDEAAAGIVRVANAAMERAMRVVSLARGHDPRDFVLFCFGGAGGLHAAELAAGLGVPEVVVPPDAGTFSAAGMMDADAVLDRSTSVLQALDAVDRARRDRLAAPLEAGLRDRVRSEGFDDEAIELVRSLDLRYAGQSFEIRVPEGADPAQAFHELHAFRHGHARREVPVEMVTLRVRATGRLRPPAPPSRAESPERIEAVEQREIWVNGSRRPAGLFIRDRLSPGQTLYGPAIISEAGSTTLVPPGWETRVDGLGNLRLRPVSGSGG